MSSGVIDLKFSLFLERVDSCQTPSDLFANVSKFVENQDSLFSEIKTAVLNILRRKSESDNQYRRSVVLAVPFDVIPSYLITKIISNLSVRQNTKNAIVSKDFNANVYANMTCIVCVSSENQKERKGFTCVFV